MNNTIKNDIKITISNNNKKLGAVPSFSVPPVLTCANCSECKKDCYALRMAKLRPQVGGSWQNNLNAYNTNPEAVKTAILSTALTSRYFRYFVGGDIVDFKFFLMMIEIAKKAKNCNFLAFTKKYDIVNDYLNSGLKIPKNLKIIFSAWRTQTPPNPYNLPVSNVIFKGDEIPQNGFVCGGNCVDCICSGVGCWQLKKGDLILFKKH